MTRAAVFGGVVALYMFSVLLVSPSTYVPLTRLAEMPSAGLVKAPLESVPYVPSGKK